MNKVKLVCLVALCAAVAAQAKQAGDLFYRMRSDGSVVVTNSSPAVKGVLNIPSEIKGGRVVELNPPNGADGVFLARLDLTAVTIPGSVTNVAKDTFADCANLAKVTFSDLSGPLRIGGKVFQDTKVKSLVLPRRTEIDDNTFYDSDLEKVTFTDVEPPAGLDEALNRIRASDGKLKIKVAQIEVPYMADVAVWRAAVPKFLARKGTIVRTTAPRVWFAPSDEGQVEVLAGGRKLANGATVKPGTSAVKLTAKNLSGATTTRTMRIIVPNLRSDVFDGLVYDEPYRMTVGDSGECNAFVGIEVLPGYSVSAKGLPSGLKLVQDGSSYYYLSGMPTKAGIYTVTLTAKNGSWTEVATFTIEVQPFPERFVGSFVGLVCDSNLDSWDSDCRVSDAGDPGNSVGAFTVSVAATGKATVKLTLASGTASFACTPDCVEMAESDDGRLTYGAATYWYYDRKTGIDISFELYWEDGLLCPVVRGEGEAFGRPLDLQGLNGAVSQNGRLQTAATYLSRLGKISAFCSYENRDWGILTCPYCMPDWGYGWNPPPDLSFTVSANGTVKCAGAIDGVKVSGSGQLMLAESEFRGVVPYADFFLRAGSSGFVVVRVLFASEDKLPYAVAGNVVWGGVFGWR